MAYAPILRQLLVAISLTVCSMSDGFIFGQMSGMIDALSSKNSSIALTEEDLSWMASSINIICILGFVLLATITEHLGRRKAISIVNLPVAVCWVLIYFAQDKMLLITTRIVLGVCYGGILVLVFLSIAEYQPPKIRPMSINLIGGVASQMGMTFGHVLSISMHWRNVALVGVIPAGLSIILPFFCVESPTWLASKGRFEESEKAFNALHNKTDISDNQLRLMLAYERKKRREISTDANKVIFGRKISMAVKQLYFWKICLFSTVICTYRVASGRVLLGTLAITLLKDITGTPDILFHTLIVDGMTIFGAAISCYLLSTFKLRGLLFVSGIIANVILIAFGLCIHMLPTNQYSSWIKVSLLAIYFVIVLSGPHPVLDTLLSEIFPTEIKSFYIILIGSISGVIQFFGIKLVPNLEAVLGYHGIFFLNAAIMFACLGYLWFYLPETKGRSLHEIEYFFKNKTYDYNKEFFKPEQTHQLLK